MGDRALALDTQGNPHIAYGGRHLYYAYYDGTVWHRETVEESNEGIGAGTSLALDAAGYPRISYYGVGDLRYAHYDGVRWQIERVDSASDTPTGHTSLALDAAGRISATREPGPCGMPTSTATAGRQQQSRVPLKR
jgi:hypothetical protein